ncbi:hypothetical protein ACIO1C_29770 [Streptomyces sp. NPDC087420]|uniref:hypothetical protein n=1 Tax=Streptomyces sp. NPDC087420 TaxID=3365785 RepID=UPI003834161D
MDLDELRQRLPRRWLYVSASEREVPRNSGEAAIYSVKYLTKREGNALGTEPFKPRLDWLPG